MRRIGLVACCATKLPVPAPAGDIYISTLFKLSRHFAQRECDDWRILSAKYGLLDPATVIAPYNETLNTMGSRERRNWAEAVWSNLVPLLSPGDEVVILAGIKYRTDLVSRILAHGCTVSVPMDGLTIGRQLQWLSSGKRTMVDELYELLVELETKVKGRRKLADCNASTGWPTYGVYFFFEPGELRRGNTCPRVVRVGTHALKHGAKSTLWGRLVQHRGSKTLLGNHRGSVFRRHVGSALINKRPAMAVDTWGQGSSASAAVRQQEINLEICVSQHLGEMSVLWLPVEDRADRDFFERNIIGLLTSNGPDADPPSLGWLGKFSPKQEIRESGLWNIRHVGGPVAPDLLERLKLVIDRS